MTTTLKIWRQDRRLLAECRTNMAQRAGTNALRERVAELLKQSPDIARLRGQHAVLACEGVERAFHHPQRGLLHYRPFTLLASYPGALKAGGIGAHCVMSRSLRGSGLEVSDFAWRSRWP